MIVTRVSIGCLYRVSSEGKFVPEMFVDKLFFNVSIEYGDCNHSSYEFQLYLMVMWMKNVIPVVIYHLILDYTVKMNYKYYQKLSI